VSFAREGLPLIAIAALLTAGTYALALNRRSWPLWLVAFALTIASLWIAYFFSDPRQPAPRGRRSAVASTTARAPVALGFADPGGRERGQPISFIMSDANVPVDRFRVNRR
jgi:4-amino-4-deoxy-L-arabinose transferase-like glycosyltransferase